MNSILLGHDQETNAEVELPVDCFRTHVHMPGATGKGKSTAIVTMIEQLLVDWRNPACHVIVDFLGGLAYDLMLWMSSKYCTPQVRDRLVFVRPSDPHVTLTLNPLLYEDYDQGFFKVNRATELILRAWSAQNLSEQPRLARWLYNAFWACAQLKLTVADTEHLLIPGSKFHRPLLDALPERLRYEWQEVLLAQGGEATRILDSTRNRMRPFKESGILRRMFGSVVNRLDAVRFMREGKVIILDLSPRGRLSPGEANAIAGLVVNEFLAAARSLPRTVRYPTYLWLDEFQRLVSPDLEYAIPEMRQLGIRLILAHQSFSQLKTKDADLTSIIFQPQTRIAFGEQGMDAEILADEFASITYNPMWVKQELYTLRQIQVGHDTVILNGWAQGMTQSATWQETYGDAASTHQSVSRRDGSDVATRGEGSGRTRTNTTGDGGGSSNSATESSHQQLIARLENIRELSSRTFYSFEEQRQLWAQRVRLLRTGQCLLRLADEPAIQAVKVKMSKPGVLALDAEVLGRRFPEVLEGYDRLIEENYSREWFVSPLEVDRETEARMTKILRPAITITTPPAAKTPFVP